MRRECCIEGSKVVVLKKRRKFNQKLERKKLDTVIAFLIRKDETTQLQLHS